MTTKKEALQEMEFPIPEDKLNENSLGKLQEALDMIPKEQKSAYLEAMRRAPHLVESEPGLMKFLHYQKFDFWKSACSVCEYWETRRSVFGPDQFVKPMHLTGNGALTKTELDVLASGFISVLPKDKRGQQVLCFIPSRLTNMKNADNIDVRRRCTFYAYSVILETSPVAQAEYSAIMITNKVGYHRSRGIKPTIDMMRVLPMYADMGLIAHNPDDVDKKSFLGSMIPRLLQVIAMSCCQVNVIAASSKEDLTRQVTDYGFEVRSLPPEFGGSWTLEDFGLWHKNRMQLELRRESNYGGSSAALESAATSPKKSSNGRGKAEGKATQRIPDKVHSQRKRIRRKAKFNALQSAYSDNLLENKRLKAQTRRLEKLLERAQETVRQHEASAAASPTRPTEVAPGTPPPMQLNTLDCAHLQP